jgi:hypothetical protein
MTLVVLVSLWGHPGCVTTWLRSGRGASCIQKGPRHGETSLYYNLLFCANLAPPEPEPRGDKRNPFMTVVLP